MIKRQSYSDFWVEMSREEKEERKKDLIKQCKEYPEITGTDYAELEEEFFKLRKIVSELQYANIQLRQEKFNLINQITLAG